MINLQENHETPLELFSRDLTTSPSLLSTNRRTVDPEGFGITGTDTVGTQGLSAILQQRRADETSTPTEFIEWDLRYLRAFLGEDMDPLVEYWLRKMGLAEAVTKIVLRVVRYFQHPAVRIELEDETGETRLLVWIDDGDNVEASLDALDRFDYEWWLQQDADLRDKVLVLLA